MGPRQSTCSTSGHTMKTILVPIIAGVVSVIACYGYHCVVGEASYMAFTGIGAITGFLTCLIAY